MYFVMTAGEMYVQFWRPPSCLHPPPLPRLYIPIAHSIPIVLKIPVRCRSSLSITVQQNYVSMKSSSSLRMFVLQRQPLRFRRKMGRVEERGLVLKIVRRRPTWLGAQLLLCLSICLPVPVLKILKQYKTFLFYICCCDLWGTRVHNPVHGTTNLLKDLYFFFLIKFCNCIKLISFDFFLTEQLPYTYVYFIVLEQDSLLTTC